MSESSMVRADEVHLVGLGQLDLELPPDARLDPFPIVLHQIAQPEHRRIVADAVRRPRRAEVETVPGPSPLLRRVRQLRHRSPFFAYSPSALASASRASL
ncbi:MAG: hypothetical protein ACP5VP_11650 [Candidatus Limnocylindrales bacterium]